MRVPVSLQFECTINCVKEVGMQGYVCWPLTFSYLEWLSKNPFLVGDSFVVKLLMNDMGYSATELKSSHSMALLAFSLAGFGRPTGNADSAAGICSSSRHIGFMAENLPMAVWISFTRLKYLSSSKSESSSSSQVLVSWFES